MAFSETFVIKNDSKGNATCKVSLLPGKVDPKTFNVKIEPSEVVVKKGKEAEVNVTIEIKEGNVTIQELLCVEVVDGKRVPVMLRIRTEKSCFGVGLERLESTLLEDGKLIPNVLLTLQEHLYRMGGLDQVGIFRLAPDEFDCAQVKKQLNRGGVTECNDVNCIANLIKVIQ
jgi:hypothetical protein